MHEYVRTALDEDSALTSLIDAEVGYSPQVYEVSIIDRDGLVLISSDDSLLDRKVLPRPALSQLVNASFWRQLRIIYGAPQAYDVSFPFQLGTPGQQVPFGEIHVASQTGLLRNDLIADRCCQQESLRWCSVLAVRIARGSIGEQCCARALGATAARIG